uniref:Dynein regulatory complex subunit 7 n=1 Tax=Ceratitis capitata TaxID=7213 RepID=W8AYE9_CERCA
MPPKQNRKGTNAKKQDNIVRIDPKQHEAKLKEIQERRRAEAEAIKEELLEEALLDEEEMGEEEESAEEVWSDVEAPFDIGRIDLSFPETSAEFADSLQCYPPSYYTLSPKERLLLLYAENFRKQFTTLYPKRRPLVLALPNECNVQKFVCTTIRPTSFIHIPLIGSETECAKFVADFITYEPLEDLMKFPTRLISPASILRKRRGNCFELATLLCSMLIGAGCPAMVVSGVARAETVLNDQRNVPFPYQFKDLYTEEKEIPNVQTGQKYKLRSMPDLESHLEENMAQMMRQKEDDEKRMREEVERLELEEMELLAVDKYHFRRSHAWVVIIDNAPWSIKPKKTCINDEGDEVPESTKARFIEPSTGFICDTHCKQYILIDSVWDHQNYYVNMQNYQRVSEIRWNMTDNKDWEHLLPGEPPEMRLYTVGSDENITESTRSLGEEKHLDAIRSWVNKLHIGLKEFEERFPNLEKTVHYAGAVHERFSPYSKRDGKTEQITIYYDNEYKDPNIRWEYYENRADLLQQIKLFYKSGKIEETFLKGRNDSLRFMEYNSNPIEPKILHFYPATRVDSLQNLSVCNEKIVLSYSERSDRCTLKEFEFRTGGQALKKTTEKFKRQSTENVPAYKDIAVRTIDFALGKILLKFHYALGALTSSTLEFIKPPKPDYGHEIKFDHQLTKLYKANISDPDPTPLELYKLLLEELKHQDKVKKQFEKLLEEINAIFDLRRQEIKNPTLKFSIFDPLRNGAARAMQMKQAAEEEALKLEMSSKPADFLAPYLVPYKNRALTYEESWAAFNSCLNELKTRFVGLLNDLQRQYEDLTAEGKSLQRFLNKFEDQFDNYNYEKLVEQSNVIALHKRMIQQRLTLTHEESQKKYETVKASLMRDERLNLKRIGSATNS